MATKSKTRASVAGAVRRQREIHAQADRRDAEKRVKRQVVGKATKKAQS
jgi:hypothetical protein